MNLHLPFTTEDAALGARDVPALVIERRGKTFEASEIKLGQAAARFLESAWRHTLVRIANDEHVPYSPEVIVRPDTPRILAINEDLRAENEVIELVLDGAARPMIKPESLPSERLYAYALVSTTAAGRIAMIKKTSPSRPARGGKMWALAKDELVLLDDAPWQLHPTFDLVVSVAGGFALSTSAFEQLFNDSERLKAKLGEWTQSVAHRLAMRPEHRALLEEACRTSARRRLRLRSIAHRGHLARVGVHRRSALPGRHGARHRRLPGRQPLDGHRRKHRPSASDAQRRPDARRVDPRRVPDRKQRAAPVT